MKCMWVRAHDIWQKIYILQVSKNENKLKTINYTYFYRAAAATPEGGTACPGFTMTHMSPDTPPTDSFLVRPY